MSFTNKDDSELGALWEKTGPKGAYMTGIVNGVKVVVLKNGKKTSDKQPDWRVMKSIPKPPTVADDDIGF